MSHIFFFMILSFHLPSLQYDMRLFSNQCAKWEKNPIKKDAEGQFYEILEDICDRCHSNALSKKTFFFIKNMYDTIV